MMNTAVGIDRLRVTRGDTLVLPDLSVEVPRGAVVGLLGPSGGGKSTLIRAIAGVQRVDSGNVTVLGEPAGSPGLRARVAYVTQSASVYPDLTAEQNVRHLARILGVPDPRAAARRALDLVDLGDRVRTRVGTMSGGQRGRVSLAGALVGEPELLLLDEPTVGLDPVLRRDLWHLFARLAAGGTTLLVSSHVMDEATRCDRLLLLRDGRLLADDTPAALLERTGASDPEDAFLRLVEQDGAAA